MNKTKLCARPGEVRCFYLLSPIFHAGYTGKSGEEASFRCARHRKMICSIKRCTEFSTTGEQTPNNNASWSDLEAAVENL